MVKGQGSRVFALGVGEAVTKPTSARRLTAISGFNQYPAKPFRNADYTLVQDFDDLGQALREIVAELCGAGVTVTKYVDKGDGKYVADGGWDFTVRVSVPGGFELDPAFGRDRRLSHSNYGRQRHSQIPMEAERAHGRRAPSSSLTRATVPGYTFVEGRLRGQSGPSKPQAHDPADDLGPR